MPLVVEELNPASLKAKEVATEEYVDTGLSEIDVSYAALTDKDQLAIELGYASYADMQSAAALGSTVINGGHLNTELIEADTLHGDTIIGGTVAGDKIIGNTITGDHIAASTIMTSPTINGGTIVGGLIQGARIEGSLIVSGSSDVTVKTEAWTDTFDSLAYQSGVEDSVGTIKNGGGNLALYLGIKSANNTDLEDYFRYKNFNITPKGTINMNNGNYTIATRILLRAGTTTIVDTGNFSMPGTKSGTGYSLSSSSTSVENELGDHSHYAYSLTINFDTDYTGDEPLNMYTTINSGTYNAGLSDIAENGV